MVQSEISAGWLRDLFSSTHTEEEWLGMFRKLPVAEQRKFQARLKETGFTRYSASPSGPLLREDVPAPTGKGRANTEKD
jgi:hypothetical protein